MCRNIIVARRAQRADTFLPDGWRFFFDEVTKNPAQCGMFVISEEEATRVPSEEKPVHMTYKSFEIAAAKYPEFRGFGAYTFYRHVGMTGGNKPRPRPSPEQAKPACDCDNCSRDACKECFICCTKKGNCIRRVSDVMLVDLPNSETLY
jgi:hypothetical protein